MCQKGVQGGGRGQNSIQTVLRRRSGGGLRWASRAGIGGVSSDIFSL